MEKFFCIGWSTQWGGPPRPPAPPRLVIQSPRRVPKEEGTSWGSGALGSRPGSVTELLFHPWQVISLSSGPQSPHFAKSGYWTRWTLNFLLSVVLFLSDSKAPGSQWGASSAQAAIIPLPTAAKGAAPTRAPISRQRRSVASLGMWVVLVMFTSYQILNPLSS